MSQTEIQIGRLEYSWEAEIIGYEDCFTLYVNNKAEKQIKLLEFQENYLEQCRDAAEIIAKKLKELGNPHYEIKEGLRTSSSQLSVQPCRRIPSDGISEFRRVLEASLREKIPA